MISKPSFFKVAEGSSLNQLLLWCKIIIIGYFLYSKCLNLAINQCNTLKQCLQRYIVTLGRADCNYISAYPYTSRSDTMRSVCANE